MRAACLLLAVAACTSETPDPGRLVTACTECGPGALLNGRFVATGRNETDDAIAANHSGRIVRAGDGWLAWLDGTLGIKHSVALDSEYGPLRARLLAMGPEDDAVVLGAWNDDFNDHHFLIAFAPDGRERWRHDLVSTGAPDAIVINRDLVIIGSGGENGYSIDLHNAKKQHVAGLDLETGVVRWYVQLPEPANGVRGPLALETTSDRSVVIGGSFQEPLVLGGAVAPLMPTSPPSGFLARLDPAGRGVWATTINPTSLSAHGHVQQLSVGPDDEIGVIGEGLGTFGTATIPGIHDQWIALVEPDGTPRWIRELGDSLHERVGSLITDGTNVIAAGNYDGNGLAFDPGGRRAESYDGFLVSMGPTGPSWLRLASGAAEQGISLHTLTAPRIIASIHSHAYTDDSPPAAFTFGDVAIKGNGFVIGELAR